MGTVDTGRKVLVGYSRLLSNRLQNKLAKRVLDAFQFELYKLDRGKGTCALNAGL